MFNSRFSSERERIMLRLPLLLGIQFEGGGIDAVAQAGGLRSVLEDVSEMSAARTAHHFRPLHAVAAILFGLDVLFGQRLVETWPACTRFIFRAGIEHRITASDAGVDAGFFRLVIFACERRLGPFIPAHMVLFGCEF